jgi:hypothetical protein
MLGDQPRGEGGLPRAGTPGDPDDPTPTHRSSLTGTGSLPSNSA